jgi:hypothetical protein
MVEWIHLEFGVRNREASLRVLGRMARQLAASGPVHLTIVDNAGGAEPLRTAASAFAQVRVIGGDNAVHEFTGWDAGLRLARQGSAGLFVLSNDTINTHHRWPGPRAGYWVGRLARQPLEAPFVFGDVMCHEHGVQSPWGVHQRWVSTYVFALSRPLLERLGTVTPEPQWLQALFLDAYRQGCGLFGDGVPQDYAAAIEGWLMSDRPGGRKWYKAAPLTAENFDALRRKAMCIVAEHMLAHRCGELGGAVVSPYDAYDWKGHWRASVQILADRMADRLAR